MTAQPVEVGNPPISVAVRRSARARRLILRVSAKGPVVTVPNHARLSVVREFLVAQEGWLRDRLDALPARVVVRIGGSIPYKGSLTEIRAAQTRSVVLEDGAIYIPAASRHPGASLKAFLKNDARQRLSYAVDLHCRALGAGAGRITLRDPKSRWGSCSAEGNLMFSWRLAMAPEEILDYVAAHEVAHLREFNHSRDFWRLVAELCEDYAYHRRWLKDHGPALHHVDFDIGRGTGSQG